MARYIDADNLTKRLCPYTDSGYAQDIDTILAIVDEEPTADVAPVMHGRWNYQKPDDAYTYKPWKCSNCGLQGGKHQTAYCPHCGAKMDKK